MVFPHCRVCVCRKRVKRPLSPMSRKGATLVVSFAGLVMWSLRSCANDVIDDVADVMLICQDGRYLCYLVSDENQRSSGSNLVVLPAD